MTNGTEPVETAILARSVSEGVTIVNHFDRKSRGIASLAHASGYDFNRGTTP
jgi:hypothetical protein